MFQPSWAHRWAYLGSFGCGVALVVFAFGPGPRGPGFTSDVGPDPAPVFSSPFDTEEVLRSNGIAGARVTYELGDAIQVIAVNYDPERTTIPPDARLTAIATTVWMSEQYSFELLRVLGMGVTEFDTSYMQLLSQLGPRPTGFDTASISQYISKQLQQIGRGAEDAADPASAVIVGILIGSGALLVVAVWLCVIRWRRRTTMAVRPPSLD